MTSKALAVMDIGKSNIKLSVLDAASGSLLHSETAQTISVNQPYYPHLDTDHVWDWYMQTLKHANAIADITFICVTAHGATAALIDNNQLVLPVLDYEYAGPDELVNEYDTLRDPFTTNYSPKLPHGLNLGRQLYWQRTKFPGEFSHVKYILPYAQFWTWCLTGIPVSEVTTIGAHTDLWNPVQKVFSSFALSQGFDKLFPPMMSAFDVLGTIKSEISDQTGIGRYCQVMVGVHDSNASIVPHLKSRSEPFTVMSTGTWVIIFAVGAPMSNLDPVRDCTANVNIHNEPVACSRFMGGREFAAIAGEEIVAADESDLVKIIDHDIFAKPAFSQEGGPFPNQVGRVTAMETLSKRERFAVASVYCALISDVSLALCGSLGDIIVEGAYSRNPLLMCCLAVFRPEQRVLASTDATGTTMGAAMLATNNIPPPALSVVQPPTAELRKKLLRYRDRWHSSIYSEDVYSENWEST